MWLAGSLVCREGKKRKSSVNNRLTRLYFVIKKCILVVFFCFTEIRKESYFRSRRLERLCEVDLYWCDQIIRPEGWECNFCLLFFSCVLFILSLSVTATARSIRGQYHRQAAGRTSFHLRVCCIFLGLPLRGLRVFIFSYILSFNQPIRVAVLICFLETKPRVLTLQAKPER